MFPAGLMRIVVTDLGFGAGMPDSAIAAHTLGWGVGVFVWLGCWGLGV